MREPDWEGGDVKLYLGDCFEILPELEPGSVDAVVTDPPYGTGAWKRSEPGAGGDCSAVHLREEWDVWNDEWMNLTDAPTVGMFTPQARLPQSMVRLFIWNKPDPRPRFAGQPAYAFEPFAIVRGSVRNCGGIDTITASSPRMHRDHDANGHPHQKPLAVLCWAVSLCSNENEFVLDPFMGSGTTGVAAVRMGRKFIGVEISEEYFKIAVRRIKEEQNTLF